MSVKEREELDPLLRDLTEKKLSFKRNVVSLAGELKDVRHRLSSQEESFTRETKTRQAAESKARTMEVEISKLQKCLDVRGTQLKETNFMNEQCLRELDDLRSQLSVTQAAAESSAASAESAQTQCVSLLKELDEKNCSIREHGIRVDKLSEQLDFLQKDLQARDLSQRQLKDEVLRIENEILHALTASGGSKDSELKKFKEDVSPESIENINRHLNDNDEEIVKLRDEVRNLSAHLKNNTSELEAQIEKHQRADQELRKRVAKLEFCLQEARSQTKKLQRMGERRERALKELKEQLAAKQDYHTDKKNFWESSGFKIIASMGMLILVAFTKR